jgi:hypothetical protein
VSGVRGQAHGLEQSRPLADWISNIRDAVAANAEAVIVLPSGDSVPAHEWLECWDRETGTPAPSQ